MKEGFTALKLGWGPMGKSPSQDVELVKAAREAIDEEVDLMVDVSLCWDATTAIQMTRKFEEFGIFWLEEPLPPDDLDGYAKLSDAVDTRIAAGEEETTRYAFRDLMERGKVDIIQPDICRAGGFTECKKIVAMAYEKNIPCVPHSFSTGINVAASMHLIATMPDALFLEYCVVESPIRKGLLSEDICRARNGFVEVPERPGLGIELNEEMVRRYRV